MTLLILEFSLDVEAQACLDAINDIAANYWEMNGYTVLTIEGSRQLVGKNAATGHDQPDSARTLTWDIIRESLDGTFYFSSLNNDPRFYRGMEQLAAYDFIEKQMPSHWIAANDA